MNTVARRFALFLTIAAVAALTPDAYAGWRVAGRIGGSLSAVALDGDTAFVGIGSRVAIYDLSGSAPREIGSTRSYGDSISSVTLAGGRAYVTAGTDGIRILDVSNPATPSEIGAWDSPGSAEGAAVDGAVIYLADGPFGLQILDATNPAAPAPLASLFDLHFAFDVAIREGRAFVAAAGAGVLVADVRDPAHPREIGSVDTPGFARDLAISGNALYLADQWGGVRAMDVTDPGRPRPIGALALDSWAYAVATSGSTLLVAEATRGVRVVDVSNPEDMRAIARYEVPWTFAWKIAAAGTRALVALRSEQFHVLDVATPAAPRLATTIAPLSNARAIAVKGSLAYVATSGQGLRIVDVSDPARPRERGAGLGTYGWAVLPDENRVYITDGFRPFDHYLRVFDVANPDAPAEIGSHKFTPGIGRDMVRDARSLYVPNEYGLTVFDMTNPAAPALSGRIEFTGSSSAGANAVALNGSIAFVNAGRGGVKAVDVSDPRNPQVVGTWSDGRYLVFDVHYRDGFLYLVTNVPFAELVVLDARDPAHLTKVGSVPLPDSGQRVVVRGSLAYIAASAAGLVIADVSRPAQPIVVARIPLPGYANHVDLSGEIAVVAGGDGGVFIVEPVAGKADDVGVAVEGAPRANDRPSRPIEPPGALDFTALRDAAAARRIRGTAAAAATRAVTVSSAADSGPGTLRDALLALQAGDTITFDPVAFPTSTPATIRPATPLPRIDRDGVTIDASNAGVLLDGSSLTGQYDAGIWLNSKGNAVKGMQIVNFPFCGIFVTGNGGNVIGGDRSRGGGPTGEGNVISRNGDGIMIVNPNGNRIVGNFIGTDATGTVGRGRQTRGIWIFYQPGNGEILGFDQIGGDQPWEANVIAGNESEEVTFQNARGHRVIGNVLGTDPSGTVRVGSAYAGVATSIAGDLLIRGNVVATDEIGIWLTDAGSTCNQIIGNWIGVTRRGAPIHPTLNNGVTISDSFNLVSGNVIGGNVYTAMSVIGYQYVATETIITGNTIGGAWSELVDGHTEIGLQAASRTWIDGNVIAGRGTGIRLYGESTALTFILGNSIGADAAGGRSYANAGDGIETGGAPWTFIQGNEVAGNRGGAVAVAGPTTVARRNSIWGNAAGGLLVDPSASGVPAPPVLTSATPWSVTGTACARCTVEIYSDDGSQGRWYEGMTAADATGSFSFGKSAAMRGAFVTATTTSTSGSTSGFSMAVSKPAAPPSRRRVTAR